MKGGGVIRAAGGGGGGVGLMRTRLRLPVVLLSCSLFFLAGFFGSLLFTQDPEEADMPVRRERLLEAALPEMPFGESGEAAPSLIPYQMVKPNGLLPKVVLHTPRIVNICRHMIRLIHLVLGQLCIMVVEIISTAALQPSKGLNPPLITRQTRRIQLQILMATGGKDHFTTS